MTMSGNGNKNILLFVLLIFIPRILFTRVGRSDGRLGANVWSLSLPPHRCHWSFLGFIFASFANRFLSRRSLHRVWGQFGFNDTIFRCNLTRNRRQTTLPLRWLLLLLLFMRHSLHMPALPVEKRKSVVRNDVGHSFIDLSQSQDLCVSLSLSSSLVGFVAVAEMPKASTEIEPCRAQRVHVGCWRQMTVGSNKMANYFIISFYISCAFTFVTLCVATNQSIAFNFIVSAQRVKLLKD